MVIISTAEYDEFITHYIGV